MKEAKHIEKIRDVTKSIQTYTIPDAKGTRRAEFVAKGKVHVGLQAGIQFDEVHWFQAQNYLKANKLEVGMLPNFGSNSLTFKRHDP